MSIKFCEENNMAYIDQGDGYHIRLEIAEVTDDFYKEKARKELNDTPENVEVALKELKELLSGLLNYNTIIFFNLRKSKCQVYEVKCVNK